MTDRIDEQIGPGVQQPAEDVRQYAALIAANRAVLATWTPHLRDAPPPVAFVHEPHDLHDRP